MKKFTMLVLFLFVFPICTVQAGGTDKEVGKIEGALQEIKKLISERKFVEALKKFEKIEKKKDFKKLKMEVNEESNETPDFLVICHWSFVIIYRNLLLNNNY